MNRSIVASLFALSLVTFASASDALESRMKAFQTAATAALAKSPNLTGERRYENPAYILANLSQALSKPGSANTQETERIINSVVVLTQNDPEVAKAGQSLIAALKTDREDRVTRARTEMDALLKKVGETCLAAKTPADLDAMIATLAPYGRNSGYDRRNEDPENYQRGANAYRFLTVWQDYLDALRQDKNSQAAAHLQDLTGILDAAIMPRSRLLELKSAIVKTPAGSNENTPTANAAAEASAALFASVIPQLEKAKTLEDFVAIVRALTVRNRTQPNVYTGSSASLQVLTNLVDDRQQSLAGLRVSLASSETGSNARLFAVSDPLYTPGTQAAATAFRRDTQFIVVQTTFRGATLPVPVADETVDAYILRLIGKFASEDNWLQVRDALDLYRTTFNNSRVPAWLTSDIEACNAYIAARNLDAAGQFPAAIASYQRALRSTGRYVPVQAIATRLAEIKKTQPDAFANLANDPFIDTAANPRALREFPPGMQTNTPPGSGPSIPRGALRESAPTGPMTPVAPATKTP
ncbi:MAG: hypothetical protein ABW223_13120 [Rariglobus sp.]